MSVKEEANIPVDEKEHPVPLEVAHSNSKRDKHLEGFSEEEKKMIRLVADIFVKSVLRDSEND